jgi:hypothetical protein
MAPITVEFPLRGEWTAAHTPAEKIPSHGVDFWGQTYAYDFLQIDWEKEGFIFHRRSTLRYLTLGLNVTDCYGYGEPIFSPANGTVVVAKDGLNDHKWLHPIADLLAIYLREITLSLSKQPNKHKMIGNYVIIKLDGIDAYALFAHIKKNTIKVKEGEKVSRGQLIANVGHTGNSTAPHLHFQIMDRIEITTAKGLPCHFAQYESFDNGIWLTITNGIPAKRERIRKLDRSRPT